MPVLTVPETRPDPFREHYRRLVLGSLLSVAETRGAQERESGHRLRAARVERDIARLRNAAAIEAPGTAAAATPHFGRGLRSTIRLAWLVTLGLLVVDLLTLGIHSWTTTIADVGLAALTTAWFWVCTGDLLDAGEPEPEQLQLFP